MIYCFVGMKHYVIRTYNSFSSSSNLQKSCNFSLNLVRVKCLHPLFGLGYHCRIYMCMLQIFKMKYDFLQSITLSLNLLLTSHVFALSRTLCQRLYLVQY